MSSSDRIIFIGAGGLGLTAAFNLARKNPDLKIIVFSRETTVAYSQCGMPFVLDGKIPGFDNLILYNPEVFKDLGLDVRTGTGIASIDTDRKSVTTDKGEEVHYDKLVIGTGTVPFVPPIPGTGLRGVHRLINLDDGRSILKSISSSKNAVIIGGGPIGLETAPAFLDRGINLTIIERMPQLLPSSLDPDMAVLLEEYLISKGARVMTGKGVSSINGAERVESVTVDGETIPADMVLLSAGVRPNVELARKAGFEIGPAGGIVVDPYFRVKMNNLILDDVFAAGDCAEVISAITNKPMLCAVGSVANRQASYLTDQLLGKGAPYGPVICPTVCVVGDLHIGSVGLNSRACESMGIKPISFKATGNTRARYYPGGKKINIKLISDGERIVGGQVIGEEGVHGRINTLSLGIKKGITPIELADMETCYAPPVSPMIDPMTYAAEMLALRCARKK
ncbi:NADH-quinone oxidoreductase subunit L [Methanocella sp. CWC-04]|uniref:NADH-quinone oxidoreductase subunit L n=1 Tax=Methanooceanicella nereidis TaxID=2052831 RepID=A0AAP2RBZ2_9EURY|nr:FAD-dependent oxidoreductase [Methanocella sp. CWC-04]MCD1294444.1 NADH-quinone oxidoreductase subunit L [Methanocella sp. CWC-04]